MSCTWRYVIGSYSFGLVEPTRGPVQTPDSNSISFEPFDSCNEATKDKGRHGDFAQINLKIYIFVGPTLMVFPIRSVLFPVEREFLEFFFVIHTHTLQSTTTSILLSSPLRYFLGFYFLSMQL